MDNKNCANCKWNVKGLCENSNYKDGISLIKQAYPNCGPGKLSGWDMVETWKLTGSQLREIANEFANAAGNEGA